MKKFVILANCQGGALAKTLMENKEFASLYECLFIPQIQRLKGADVPDVLRKIQVADLFIYQPIAIAPQRPVELTSTFLLEQVRRGTKIISFPPIYFDGYFPHLQTLKGYVSALRLVHDYFIAYSCSIGLTIAQTIKLIQNENLYPEGVSMSLVERSLKNLSDREIAFNIDIKLSKFISDNYKHEKLFNQFNHPKRAVFKYLAERILERIGIENPYINEKRASYLDDIMTPIYKSTYKNLKLEFNEDFETYNGLGGTGLKQGEVVKRFFEFYRNHDLGEINLFISKNKPFVPRIVEANLS